MAMIGALMYAIIKSVRLITALKKTSCLYTRRYHPQRSVVIVSVAVYMHVCLYVCNTINFKSIDVESSFGLRRYLMGTWVRFICEGRGVRVKVTAAKKAQNSHFCNV